MKSTKTKFNILMLIVIALAGITSMIIVTPHDFAWTKWLHDNNIEKLTHFMADSIFEGEKVGGGDFSIFFLIIVAALYLLSWTQEITNEKTRKWLAHILNFLEKRPKFGEKLRKWRPKLGYIAISCFTCALYVVHTIKWSTGRARPRLIFKGQETYSEWYEMGAHFIAEGSYRGAFPSGHTATAFTFMALAYVLFLTGSNKGKKWYGMLTGVFSLAIATLMMISRSMSAAHWVTDSVFVIFFNWAIMHVFFFWGLNVPKQEKYYNEHGKSFPLPLFYELKLAFYMLIASISIIMTVNGIRSVMLNIYPWLIFMAPVGLLGLLFAIKKLYQLGFFRKGLKNVFADAETKKPNKNQHA